MAAAGSSSSIRPAAASTMPIATSLPLPMPQRADDPLPDSGKPDEAENAGDEFGHSARRRIAAGRERDVFANGQAVKDIRHLRLEAGAERCSR